MASSGDIRAGRAAVELYVDQSELQKGLKQAETSIKNVDKNVGSMRAGMLANQFAVGLQDAAVVYEQTKDIGRALSAAANNAIQLMTMISPMAGALTAAAIAAYQLYNAFAKAASSAKAMNEAAKEGAKSLVGAIGDSVDTPKTKADIQEDIDKEEKKQKAIRDVRNQNNAEIFKLENQTNVLGFTKTLDEHEQRRVDTLKAENYEYNRAIDAGTKRLNQLQQEQSLAEDANGKTTKQIQDDEERMEKEAEAIWESVKREEEQWKYDSGLKKTDEEIEADKIHAEAKLQSDKWKADMDSQRRQKGEDVTRQFETRSQRRARMGAEYDGLRDSNVIDGQTYNRAMASLNQKSTSVVGTFSGAALGGLSASSPLVAIQQATERTAKATETMSKKKGGTFD